MAKKQKNFTVQDEIRRDRRMRQARQYRRARTNLRRLVTAALCIAVFLLLAVTVTVIVTRVQTVSVSGNLRYTDAALLEAAALDGEILPLVGEDTVYRRIAAVCPYVERIELIKTYPSAVEIVITETEAVYATETHGKWISLDRELRVMDVIEQADGLIRLLLPELQSALEGSRIAFADETADAFVLDMLSVFFPEGAPRFLSSLDLRDRYAIVGMVGEQAKILFGDYRDSDVKLRLAAEVLADAVAENSERTLIDVSEPSRASAQYDYKGDF